jgi:hypothetical protein
MRKENNFKKNPDMVTRVIDKEVILVPIFKTSDEMNCIYTLNPAASFAWDLIDGKKGVEEIKSRVFHEFSSTEKEITKEIDKLFKDLKSIKAII